MAAGYYLTALVFHDQSKELAQYIGPYLDRLSLEGLADIPFHGVDLIHGHGDYEGISPEKRKRHLIAFSMFVRTLPITYRVFSYERTYTEDRDRLEARLRKDIIDFVFDRLDDFQLYDQVAIYYDGGQEAVTASLHGAFDYALARSAAVYKPLSHQEKRLAQAADYLCTVGLAERRYERGDVSASYRRFSERAETSGRTFLSRCDASSHSAIRARGLRTETWPTIRGAGSTTSRPR